MYTMYPTKNSIVIAGPTCGAGYSARSQLAARITVLAQNPSATGTARGYDGDAPVMVGHIAGVHLDAERPRPPLPGVQGVDPVTGGTRWTFLDGSYVRADSNPRARAPHRRRSPCAGYVARAHAQRSRGPAPRR